MKTTSGILLYRYRDELEVFLAHPGGPFWKNKDNGAWTIPKGEFTDEQPLDAAIREFEEETGKRVDGNFIELEPVSQKGRKMVYAWALEGDIDPAEVTSNTFTTEWPPKSGQMKSFPEVDRGAWFSMEQALEKINPAQAGFVHDLVTKLESRQD